MMSFKQFILEKHAPLSFKELVHQYCPTWLGRSGGKGFLFRGIGTLPEKPAGHFKCTINGEEKLFPFYKMTVRKDRRSLDMKRSLSKVIDDWFNDRFDFRARSESLFCWQTKDKASRYGNYACLILPMGKWSYVWSPKVRDLYASLTPEIENLDIGSTSSKEQIYKFMGGLQYTHNNLEKYMADGIREIMVDCDSYIAIPVKHFAPGHKFVPATELFKEMGMNDDYL